MKFYTSEIFHRRSAPVNNSFAYKGLYFSFWLDEEREESPRFFSWEKFNLFSFHKKDHGDRRGGALYQWAIQQLEKVGILSFKGRIELHTMPRILGFVFNPVSFWYCYEGDELAAVVCEVNNTFGESHTYVIPKPLESSKIWMKKNFHVSPFYPVEGKYKFDFTKKNSVIIHYQSNDGDFIASSKGHLYDHKNNGLLKLFLSRPFYTFLVVFLIHFQALKLFLKRVKFYKKPQQNKIKTTSY